MKITNISPVPTTTLRAIPARGYYIELFYDQSSPDLDACNRIGPFPADKKHLCIELLNILEAMLEAYPNGKSYYDDYVHVPGYTNWFDKMSRDTTSDDTFRSKLNIPIQYYPDADGCPMELSCYKLYFHDGTSPDRIPVKVA